MDPKRVSSIALFVTVSSVRKDGAFLWMMVRVVKEVKEVKEVKMVVG